MLLLHLISVVLLQSLWVESAPPECRIEKNLAEEFGEPGKHGLTEGVARALATGLNIQDKSKLSEPYIRSARSENVDDEEVGTTIDGEAAPDAVPAEESAAELTEASIDEISTPIADEVDEVDEVDNAESE